MSQLLGVIRHEFNMSIQRMFLWIPYGMIFIFLVLGLNTSTGEGMANMLSGRSAWQEAGEVVYMHNLLLPLVAGILSADRARRDWRLNLRELQCSSPLQQGTYVLGKYLGVLLSTLVPALVFVLLYGVMGVVRGLVAPSFLLAQVAAFAAIVVPAFAFVIAFSLACPLVMPPRVYQILFTGYWFWGNYITDNVVPTISDTLLNASGYYAVLVWFRSAVFNATPGHVPPQPIEAYLNIIALLVCAGVALFVMERYLTRQMKAA